MGDSIILTVYFPLIITGMILTIMWGMSAAASRRPGLRQTESERNHSREG